MNMKMNYSLILLLSFCARTMALQQSGRLIGNTAKRVAYQAANPTLISTPSRGIITQPASSAQRYIPFTSPQAFGGRSMSTQEITTLRRPASQNALDTIAAIEMDGKKLSPEDQDRRNAALRVLQKHARNQRVLGKKTVLPATREEEILNELALIRKVKKIPSPERQAFLFRKRMSELSDEEVGEVLWPDSQLGVLSPQDEAKAQELLAELKVIERLEPNDLPTEKNSSRKLPASDDSYRAKFMKWWRGN